MKQQFKIRASQAGVIMTNARAKSELLSQTCKTYLEEWQKEQLYGRKKTFSSKYTTKGNIMEDTSLDMASELLKVDLVKNEEEFKDTFMTGTPDAIMSDAIVDVKSSWDAFTFPLFETECPNKNYWWQMQVYMGLVDRDKAHLVYCLTDTPKHLIQREANNYCFLNGYKHDDPNIFKEHEQRMTYGDVDAKLRVKSFLIERDTEAIKAIEQRVKDCREYIKTLKS